MMRFQSLVIMSFMVLGGAGLLTSTAGTSATQTTTGPIPLEEVRSRGIIGELGVPLGKLITVTGKAVATDTKPRNKDESAEPFFLRILTVDGKALPTPVEYPFRERLHGQVTPPKVGESFQFTGYESGGFDGVPSNYSAKWQDRSFYFITTFYVLPAK